MSAKIVYKDYNQNESLLFPPTLGELVPENHRKPAFSADIGRTCPGEPSGADRERGDRQAGHILCRIDLQGRRDEQFPSAHASESDSLLLPVQCIFRPQDGASPA